jgi:type II secretory pathway pseudopilin PulG
MEEIMPNSDVRTDQCGFTYVGLLIVVALFGIGLAAVGEVWHTTLLREKERDLLFTGDAYRAAIASYYDSTPGGGAKQFPKTMDDLLLDRRFPTTRRHLRKIYADPLTGKSDWGIVNGPGGTIMGVYSLSQLPPKKTKNFPEGYESFESAKSHADWRFAYAPSANVQPEPKPKPKPKPLAPSPQRQITTSSIVGTSPLQTQPLTDAK